MSSTRPTIRDVAALAGVSHQTVSRVINKIPLVREDTRRRVEEAIEQLGFTPNAIARSMAQGQTFTLACISHNLVGTFARIIEGAVEEARRAGYFLLAAPAEDEAVFSTMIDQLVHSRRTDGLMVIKPYIDKRYQFLPPQFPIVFSGVKSRGEPYSSVAFDNHYGAKVAIQHLLELGHSQIAMISGPLSDDSAKERSAGFQEKLAEVNLSCPAHWIYEGDWSSSSGRQAFLHFNQVRPLPTAIFSQNDFMALGAMRAMHDAGIRIPGDISIIGVDDINLSSYFEPALTTMRLNTFQMGVDTTRLLIQAVEYPKLPQQHISLPCELVVRESTGPVRTG
jgi:LacI family repressor for deo operon, udp, cdd, tsx, nupC, and nupG